MWWTESPRFRSHHSCKFFSCDQVTEDYPTCCLDIQNLRVNVAKTTPSMSTRKRSALVSCAVGWMLTTLPLPTVNFSPSTAPCSPQDQNEEMWGLGWHRLPPPHLPAIPLPVPVWLLLADEVACSPPLGHGAHPLAHQGERERENSKARYVSQFVDTISVSTCSS